jgi:hypothetical protein
MADRTLTDPNGATPRKADGQWTFLAASLGSAIPSKSIVLQQKNPATGVGLVWEGSRSQTYENCVLLGVSQNPVDTSLEDEQEQDLVVWLGGDNVLWDAGVFSSDAAADAAGCFRVYCSGSSDGVAAGDARKTVYQLDGRTLAVADAATTANRPHNNAVPFGEIVEVIKTGTSGRVVVRQFTHAESRAIGNYYPTGNPFNDINPYHGHAAVGTQPNVFKTLFRQAPQLNATSAIASGGLVSAATTAAALAADRDLEISGTNASDDDVTVGTHMQLIIGTDGADADQVFIFPHQDTLSTSLKAGVLTDASPCFGVIIKSTVAVTARRLKYGLVLTAVNDVGTDADQVFVSYGTDASDTLGVTYWNLNTSISNVDAQTATTHAVTTDQVRLEIRVNPARVPTLWIDGVKRATGSALTTAISLKPLMMLEDAAGTDPIMHYYAMWVGCLTT